MKRVLPLSILLFMSLNSFAQIFSENRTYTHQDSLRGSIGEGRIWWDLKAYRLELKPHIKAQALEGSNRIVFQAIEAGKRMQIDLQYPMQIDEVSHGEQQLKFEREGNVYWIDFEKEITQGQLDSIQINFSGKPKISSRPPWDGGLTWEEDSNGKAFIATSVQGEGASLFWPNKDHMYDEAEEMDIYIEVPSELVGVSNGRLISVDTLEDHSVYHWQVTNPINNYGVNMNIGDYVHFSEVYQGEKGALDCDYWVLRENLKKAKKQFKQVPKMLEAFEYWFGPYPFYEDSFKLVEVPYLGMEHQSSVTYGNGYKNGYRGSDLSRTGWGLKFDFIIIHEAGHEWFANNITNKDIADMWIHESFTAYSEGLYLEYHYGKKAGQEYVRGTRALIANDTPIIGIYGVNQEGSGDMYYKGSNMLNTLRTWLDDDELWRTILRGLNSDFYHQTVDTDQIENYIAEKSNLDLNSFFEQYLRTIQIPILDYKIEQNSITYRYRNTVPGFDMPLKIEINGKEQMIKPQNKWITMPVMNPIESIEFDSNYYIELNQI